MPLNARPCAHLENHQLSPRSKQQKVSAVPPKSILKSKFQRGTPQSNWNSFGLATFKNSFVPSGTLTLVYKQTSTMKWYIWPLKKDMPNILSKELLRCCSHAICHAAHEFCPAPSATCHACATGHGSPWAAPSRMDSSCHETTKLTAGHGRHGLALVLLLKWRDFNFNRWGQHGQQLRFRTGWTDEPMNRSFWHFTILQSLGWRFEPYRKVKTPNFTVSRDDLDRTGSCPVGILPWNPNRSEAVDVWPVVDY